MRQLPLNYVAAPTAVGAASTLEVRVNDVLWHEVDSLVNLTPGDRAYSIQIEDDGATQVTFGNGKTGSRLPTGMQNIKAIYRSGIGKVGNAKAEQIKILASHPLGLKSVINPLPATGGADPESRDQARRNAPLSVMAIDRLVSMQDYADFARTFAGIGKTSAQRLSDGRRQVAHLTIAGADNIPIDRQSDLYHNLVQALRQLGDPNVPIQVEQYELMLLILIASVRILSDYQWEAVYPKLRQALLDTFSFAKRELGQSVFHSEVITVMQQVDGVAYVDIDVFGSVSASDAREVDEQGDNKLVKRLQELSAIGNTQSQGLPEQYIAVKLARAPERINPKQPILYPAQLAILSPDVVDTLILKEVKS